MIRLQKSDEIEIRLDHLYYRLDFTHNFRSIGLVNVVRKQVESEINNLEIQLAKLMRYKNDELHTTP